MMKKVAAITMSVGGKAQPFQRLTAPVKDQRRDEIAENSATIANVTTNAARHPPDRAILLAVSRPHRHGRPHGATRTVARAISERIMNRMVATCSALDARKGRCSIHPR